MALVIGLLATLFVATTGLTGWYQAERAARAAAHRDAGRTHTARGELALGVEQYRAALLLERDDMESARGLAQALLELGRLAESESYFTDLLQRDPVSGPLNLGLARIRSQRGVDDEARRLYQRAIYGEWIAAPDDGRLSARFELAEYLQTHATRDETLAELLRLKAEMPADAIGAARRLADLFLLAAAPELAVDVLRGIVDTNPADIGLLAALFEAHVRAGQSADARRVLRRALALDPGRADLRERLQIVDRALTLDPTLPNLRLTTRARRARALLSQVVMMTATCDAGSAAGGARRTARQRLEGRRTLTVDVAENDLALAGDVWLAAADCRATGPDAQAVSQVIERLRVTTEDPQP